MSVLKCRGCGAQISSDAGACPRCGVQHPFICSACGREIGGPLRAGMVGDPITEDELASGGVLCCHAGYWCRVVHLRCRECGAQIGSDSGPCPGCGCTQPFACSVCGRPVFGGLTRKKPNHGSPPSEPCKSLSRSGEPLCHVHQLVQCHRCRKWFHWDEVEERDSWELDTRTNWHGDTTTDWKEHRRQVCSDCAPSLKTRVGCLESAMPGGCCAVGIIGCSLLAVSIIWGIH